MPMIYCVEDDDSIRELVVYALSSGGFEARGFESGEALLAALADVLPDLVLLDIMLPGEDGISLLSRLRAISGTRRMPILMLTAKSSEYDKVKALDLGADDYIVKPFGVMELLSRVRAVLRRCTEETEDTLSCGEICVNLPRREVLIHGEVCPLTYKEFELLVYLIKNCGIVLSRSRIMDAVWGFDYEGESRTVDMHIKSLRQKLERCSVSDVIKTVRSVGYMLEVER